MSLPPAPMPDPEPDQGPEPRTCRRRLRASSPTIQPARWSLNPAFTLDKMSAAMRGMPRDARITVKLPDGRLVDIAFISPTRLHDKGGQTEATPCGASYGILLVTQGE